jgi:molybdenum cofactor synthesis domain-containing protein
MRVGILTVSDRCFRKEMADESGVLAREFFGGKDQVIRYTIVPDERSQIIQALVEMADALHLDLILTIGGTGLGPRDVTPEATDVVIDRPIPGIPEYLRRETFHLNQNSVLSRALSGLRGRTLIVNLPGHPEAVRQQLSLLLPLLPHIQEMVEGKGHPSHTEALP